MKTLHTTYNNFAKRVLMSLMLLMTIGVNAVLGDDNAFIDIYRSPNPLIYTTTPTVVETEKPVKYYFTGESQQSSDQGLDWQNGVSLTLEVPNNYSISKVIIVPYASSSIGDIVLVSNVEGSISRESQFVWTASDLVNQSVQEIVLKQSSSNGQKTRIKSISVTYQSSSMHTITWKVDGETYTEGNPSYAVAHGEKVNKLPTSPTSLPCDGKTFIGWAEENDYENYFYDVPSSPVIEESKTFHAVFASVAQAGGNSKTETLNGSDLVYSGNNGYVAFTATTASGTWSGKANYNTDGYIQINQNKNNYHIGSPTFAGNVKSIKITTTNSSAIDRTFYIRSSNTTAQPTSGDLGSFKTTTTNQSFTIDLTTETKQFYIYSSGAVYISSVVVTYASNSYQDYTISCSSENTITLDPNGGESWTTTEINTWQGPDANGFYTKSVEKNTTVVLPTPTKIDNQFAGWIDDAANPVSSPYTPNSNVTLTAQWTPNQHTLTWELNGGTVTTAGTPSGNVAYGTSIQAPQVAKTGYTFNGWSPEFTVETTMPDDDLTYTAQWRANTYTVQFDANGGTGTMSNQSFTYDANPIALSANTFTWTGYNFTGWNTVANGSGTNYVDKAEVKNLTAEPNGVITLYAQWTPKSLTNYRTLCTYDITWLIGGDPYTEGNPTTTVQAGKTITALPTNPLDDALGCCADKFMGWTVSTAQTIDKADVFTTLAEAQTKFPNITSNKTFYAVFATTAQGVGTSIADFSEMGYENGTAVTDQIILGDGEGHGDATITLQKAQSSKNDAKYYDDGEAVRVYAGSTIRISSTYNGATIKSVTFEFSASDTEGDNIISVTGGDGTYSEGTWTGDATAVTFTIGGSTGHRRIASITVTTGVSGSQYTNYVTNCTLSGDARLGEGTIQYANEGTAIAVNCGRLSSKNSAATLTFPDAQYLTCPITLTASNGFVLSTNKSGDAYAQTIKVTPYKQGSSNPGKLRTIYIRANAEGKTENFNGTITIAGGEIATTTINVSANVNCAGYTFTLTDHLGNIIGGTPISHYEGDIIEDEPAAPTPDACSENYTFDGWSESAVEYGSLVYNKVTFPFTMPAENVTLIPVYRLLEDVDEADYHRVTSDLGADDVDGNNWAGDYLIAAEKNGVCHFANGAADNIGVTDSKKDLSVNDNIVSATEGDQYFVKLIAVDYGYVLQSNSGKYNYIRDNADSGLDGAATILTATTYPLTVAFDGETKTVSIANKTNKTQAALQYTNISHCFRFYTPDNQTPIYLYRKSPLYTSYLACGTIDVTGNEVYVTATQNRGVMAPEVLTVTAEGMYPNANVILTSNSSDVYFSIDRTANFEKVDLNKPKTSLSLNADADGNLQQDIYVHYKPGTTGNGVPADVVVTAKSDNLPISDDQTIHVRNLPAQFVIATKVGSHWYALPADMSAATNPEGVLIEVNEATMTATAPNTTSYTLFPVKTTNGEYDRYATNTTHYEGNAYGDRVRFAAVNNNNGLWANNNENGNTIRNNAAISSVSDGGTTSNTNPSYEWKITTTVVDGHWQYTLQTDQTQNQNYLRYWVGATGAPKWGTYAAGNDQLYFLPVTETEPFDYQVVEWYPTKMLIQTDATIANPTAKIGDVPINNVTCTNKGGKLYEIAGLPLESNPTKVLTINFNDYTCAKAIPVIISRSTTNVSGTTFTTLTKDVYNYADLVVRDGAKLTIDGGTHAENTFFNVTIYPTSKISVPSDKKLTVHSLTFFGGIGEIYDGSAYTLNKYGVPQLSLKGTLGKTVTTIDYIMRVNLDQMYQVGVPYDVNLNEITYWDGTSIALGTALYVSAYDGAARARLDWDNTWQWEVNFAEKVLKAGIGYTISAEPQVAGDAYSILRMPMKNNINSGNTETQKATIKVTAHGMSDENLTDNHKGWNYLSNPYMTSISGAESGGVDNNNIVVGYLVETGTGPWEWVNDTYRYVTIPYDDGTNYDQRKFSEATLLPFKSFFLQIANTGDLSFALASRLNAPMRHLQQQENAPREVEFELLLSNDAQSDNTGLLISEEFTPAYEINADLEKMIGTMSVYTIYNGYQLAYNALSPLNAMEEIPLGYVVPATGEYTFNLDERGDLDDIEHIYLLDHDSSITTDLMEDIYTFTATEKKNDHRFAISVILKAEEEEETPTHLETLEWESDHPYKFIYQDKMYILRNGVIYDAMGKQVQTINK